MKNPFYFSKGQRMGVVVLLVLLIAVIAADVLLPRYFSNAENSGDLQWCADTAIAFESQLRTKESERSQKWVSNYTSNEKQWEDRKKQPVKVSVSLFAFDPNTTDSVDFVRLGIRPKVAGNIVKYRNKGGVFRTAEQFGKIYGISEEQFETLKPYIQIVQTDTLRQRSDISQKEVTVLELNTADTTELKLIRGIGRGTAISIVRYRKKLGGFYTVEQLREIPYMKETTFQSIKNHFTVNTALIQPIDVNKANAERLYQHPYIDFTLAKAIYELRRNKLKLNSVNDLSDLEGMDAERMKKLTPYLTFGK